MPCLLGGLIGLIAFASSLGLEVVDPRAYTWLLRDDWSIHFLGWHLFRAGPWELPLGATPLLRAPVGSSVGLTDSIPALAALFKLADPLLPVRAQYIGLWLLCCFVLQGVFGVLLMRLVSSRRSLQLVGAALLVLSPPLLFRIRHPALTAHWLLLAALWLYFGAASGKPTTKLLAWWALVTGVAAATHPYNTLMVFAFTMAAYARQVVAAPSSAPRILAHVVTLLACAGLLLWQSGYFAVGQTRDLDVKGLGFLSMNLLAPIIPLDGSTLLGPGPANLASPWQFEGYAYLGAGVLLLGVVAVSRLLWSARHLTWARTAWHHVPFAIACVALTTLAVSPTVTFGARTLFEYDGRWWGPFSVFRASGRLFWPVFYAISFGILAGVARMRYRWALTFLTIAVAVQAFDVSGSYRAARQYRALGFDNPLQSHFWTVAPKHYKHLVLVPSNLCDWEGIFDHTPFALLAGDYGLSINAGGTARFDTQRVEQYCAQMRRNLRSRAMSPDAMYVLRPGLVAPFQAGANPRVVCTPVDGFGVCVVSETYLHWQDGYDVVRLALPPTSDFIGFYHELDQYYRERLQRPPFATHGSREERLGALVKYLAYRLAGCDHDESERKTLGEVRRDRELRLCADSVPTTALPPPDDTLRFRQRLEAVYRDELSKATETTSVDAEGEAVWVQQYARDRLAGKSDREARQGVLQTIDAIAGR